MKAGRLRPLGLPFIVNGVARAAFHHYFGWIRTVAVRNLNIPNLLTLSRILLVPFILLGMAAGGRWSALLAAAGFATAAFTDFIDGYLARSGNQITRLGKFLDPLADKVLVCSVLVMLVQLGHIGGWIAIVIICRDIMVTGLRAIAADEGVVIAADKFGKMKTIMQMSALAPLILHHVWFGISMHDVGIFLLYIALVLTVFSGCNYFWAFSRIWRDKPGPKQTADERSTDA